MSKRLMAIAATAACLALAAPAQAQLRDKWCSKVSIRFFVGGAEGDAFGTIVYNGARQAAADTGARVDYLFSGWDRERMIQQLREAVAAKPDGIAMMGHPGPSAIMPLAQQAAAAGIAMMYQNVDVPDVRTRFGGGYVGANLVSFGMRARPGSDQAPRAEVGRPRAGVLQLVQRGPVGPRGGDRAGAGRRRAWWSAS